MKKRSTHGKTALIIAVAAVIFLGLSVTALFSAVSQTRSAISAIGTVGYNEESQARLDAAVESYSQLSSALGATTTFRFAVDSAVNYDSLTAAKQEYVRLAIKTASVADSRKAVDGYTDEELQTLIAAARAAADAYFGEDGYDAIENYQDLELLESKYISSTGDVSAAADGQSEEDIELC